MITNDDGMLIRQWLNGFGSNTVRSYRIDVLDFFDYVQAPMHLVPTAKIRLYLDVIAEIKTPTVARRITTAIKSLFLYAVTRGHIKHNPAATLHNSIPEPPRNPISLPEATIKRLLRNAGSERDYAVIALAYYGALRGVELTDLLWGDLLHNRLRVRTLPAQRVIILPQHLVKRLNKLRGEQRLDTPMLASRNGGGPITVRSIDRIVYNISQQIGETVGGLNVLRNTHATHALARGAALGDVQAALGHSTLRATVRHARSLQSGPAATGAMLAKPTALAQYA